MECDCASLQDRLVRRWTQNKGRDFGAVWTTIARIVMICPGEAPAIGAMRENAGEERVMQFMSKWSEDVIVYGEGLIASF